MVKFIIVRHGYSTYNKERRFSGQADIGLDEIGFSQARSIAGFILDNFHIDSIYSSDLTRAYDTIEPTARALGLPIVKNRALRELDVGEWQGMLISEVEEKYPEAFKLYKTNVGLSRPSGGESYAEMARRAATVFDEIARENEGKTVLTATHGGIIRVLRCVWAGLPLEEIQNIRHVPNASISVAEYSGGRGIFTDIGFTGHLTEHADEQGIN